ncbi:MAG: hypothetical protein NWE93_00555 [Candidatus Bathyarchaeota archaeon]|nr:hypothetical protein [Candidatus Bathyarchaeota archaeon]
MEKVQGYSAKILNRIQLANLKRKAVRAGVWYRALPRIDRVLVDLTIKVTENIRSPHLAKSIFAVVGKLEELLMSRIHRLAHTVGRSLAEKTSQIAQSWGNASAKRWSTDWSFAIYLAVLQANK